MTRTIQSHGLSAPTEHAAVESMARVLGDLEARTVWNRAKRQSGVDASKSLTLSELLIVADELSRFSGFKGVMGTALRIRIQTYQMLDAEKGIPRSDDA